MEVVVVGCLQLVSYHAQHAAHLLGAVQAAVGGAVVDEVADPVRLRLAQHPERVARLDVQRVGDPTTDGAPVDAGRHSQKRSFEQRYDVNNSDLLVSNCSWYVYSSVFFFLYSLVRSRLLYTLSCFSL